MQFIHNQISRYLDEQDTTYRPLSDEDIRDFASDGSSASTLQAGAIRLPKAVIRANQATKFLKLIIMVVIKPPNTHVLNQIQTLPQQTQQVIKNLIQQADPLQSLSDDDEAHEESGIDSDRMVSEDGMVYSSAQRVKRELEFEEHQAKLQSKLNRRERDLEILEAEKEDVDTAYQRLQESYEAMRIQFSEQEDQLKRLTLAHNNMDQQSIRELEAKISQLEETVASKEFQLTEHQSLEAEQQRRISKLNAMADEFQKLQDEFYIQKAELLEQTKKANAGEKYKQKVQASQVIERERDALRLQLEEARPRLKAYDDLRRDNARLVKENREISSTLSQSEIGNSELRETKQGVVAENDRLRRELKVMREAYAQGQENIANLEDGSSASEAHSSPTIVDGGLESELVATSKFEEQMQVSKALLLWIRGLMDSRKSRIVELENQNRELVDSTDEKESKILMLQQQLDSSVSQPLNQHSPRQDIPDLETFLQEVRKGHPLEESVSPTYEAIGSTYNVESTQAFKRMRDQLKDERKKNTHLERKLSTAYRDAENANNDRTSSFEMHCMMLDLNIDLLVGEFVGKPKPEMIEGVDKQCSASLVQMKERSQARSSSHEGLTAHVEGEKDTITDSQSLHELTEMIRKATAGEPADTSVSIEQTLAPFIERNRELVAKKQQVNKILAVPEDTQPSISQSGVRSHLPSPIATFTKGPPRRFFLPNDANML